MRAIHLEKLCSMEGDSFINALIRFIARRGKPKKIRYDYGTIFTRGDKDLYEKPFNIGITVIKPIKTYF